MIWVLRTRLSFNPLSPNTTKWSNALKEFFGYQLLQFWTVSIYRTATIAFLNSLKETRVYHIKSLEIKATLDVQYKEMKHSSYLLR